MKPASHAEVAEATPIAAKENELALGQLFKKITWSLPYTEEEKDHFADLIYCMNHLEFISEMDRKLFLLFLSAIHNDSEFSAVTLDFNWIIDLHSIVFEKGNRGLYKVFNMNPSKIYIKPRHRYNKQFIWDFIENYLAARFIFDCNQLRKIRNINILNPEELIIWNLFPFWLYQKEKEIYYKKGWISKRYEEIAHIPFEQVILYLPVFLLRQFDYCCGDKANKKYLQYLCEGNNIRKASFLPFKITKKMAFHFHQLKINTEIYHTIRREEIEKPFSLLRNNNKNSWNKNFGYPLVYAFVMGLGGDAVLVRAFAGICPKIDDYDFQKSVIEFVIRYEIKDEYELRRLLGYLFHLRHESGKTYVLKRRTATSVYRDLYEYYDEQQRIRDRDILLKNGMLHAKWKGANYKSYQKENETGEYQIIQLMESLDLIKEGRVMHHCVKGYVGKCMTNRCSIWSLREKTRMNEWKALVTIEVNNSGEIIQAKSKYNYKPSEKCMEMIQEWATNEGIKIVSQ